jgi:hypothetical protein
MEARRNQLAQEAKVVAENAQRGQQAMTGLLQSVESALQLAKHADKWEWKEVQTTADEKLCPASKHSAEYVADGECQRCRDEDTTSGQPA